MNKIVLEILFLFIFIFVEKSFGQYVSNGSGEFYIESFYVNGNKIDIKKILEGNNKLILKYSENTIQIVPKFVNDTLPQGLKFIYKLEGIDDDWVDLNENKSIRYPKISPGTYKLLINYHVTTDKVFGKDILEIPFVVLPHWTQTAWFYSIIGFLLTSMIFFYYRYRIKQIRDSVEKEIKKSEFDYVIVELQDELLTYIQQYLNFFPEYVRIAKQQIIEFEVEKVKNGLKLKTKFGENIRKENFNKWLNEYIGFVKNKVENFDIEIEGNPSTKEIDLLRLKLENQIAHLENSLKIVGLENQYLKENNEFLKKLSLSFSEKDNVIHNQYIQGGEQQFANQIKNKS